MPFTEHSQLYQELQVKYRCLDCDPSGNKWCWIQEFKGMHKPYHAPLDDGHLDTWATYIEEKTATIFYPPRIPEFDNVILEPFLKKYKPTSASIAESSIPPVNPGLLREVHYNYIPNDNRHHK